MMKAANLMEKCITTRFPGIATLAKSCGMSPTKFKLQFKKVHGLTPLEFFRTLQIMSMSGLRKGKEKTVKEIASDLGMKKHSDFTEWYQKVKGENSGFFE